MPASHSFPQSTDNNAALQACLTKAVEGDAARAQFPSEENFRTQDVKPYNRQYPYTPTAVILSSISGADGAVTVDLKNLNQLSVDQATGIATIGPANDLKAVNEGLHDNGRRMIPHGTSATVGIGGHTLVGGFSPVTRRAGLTLDALREVEVVPANGIVARAPASQHPDLFWATRGAGQSFGVATEFVFQTKPEPSNPIISYQCNITSPSSAVLAGSWQAIIAGPQLPRDLYTLAFLQGATLLVRGTFSDALALASRIPGIASGGVTGEASWPATSADLFRFFASFR
ncbi:putative glucooligosaccharide oxidase protein [Neofusicoccum parvum UCRNP2]|uniref:Putative glucooligosaccharide oxidase protein n=1 Tax=Botryosphaeria parva (strain UCR-NP2) TaxID=1287680 RepID=R1FW28_BOTPV|nr:putative glucooligosaccharide oxidase protein [Neofusicoccum parvum UCRNP2]